jgi:hypothetical protein
MGRRRLKTLFAMVCFAVAGPAAAATIDSAYTKLVLDSCRSEPPAADDPLQGGVWWCEGYGGMKVRVAEGDLRFLVSYGDNAANEMAAGETVPAFNHIGETLEWRLEQDRASGQWRPFATILRYFTDADGGQDGQLLAITKLGGPGQICHIGYVDAVLNKDANALARQVADETASGFVCGTDMAKHFGLTAQQ